jgi:hypothetical protein
MEDKAHVEATMEDALGWLDEHLEKMIQDNPYLNDPYHRYESMSENCNRTGRNNAIREIRRIYIAPEVIDPLGEAKEREAAIRREARQRCIDEIMALTCGLSIEAGVGEDIRRAYLLSVQKIQQAKMEKP